MLRRPLCAVCCLFVSTVFLLTCTRFTDAACKKAGADALRAVANGEACADLSDGGEAGGAVIVGRVEKKGYRLYGGEERFYCCLREGWEVVFASGFAEEDKVLLGGAVYLTGRASAFLPAQNPGEFDARTYYARNGLYYRLRDASLLDARGGGGVKERVYRLRRVLVGVFRQYLSAEDASVASAMLLNEKKTLDTELKALYRNGGIIHILAISGLHISLLGEGVYRILKRTKLPPSASAAAAFAVVFFYGMLIDAEGASVRAIVMFSLRLLAQVLQRTYDLPTALSLAAVLLLCREPFYVRDAGFLFSFTAALSLGVFSPLFALSETGIRQETGLLPHNFTRSKKKARPAKIQKGSVRKEQNALPSTHQDTLPNALQKVRERLENARLRFLQAAVKSLSACVCAVVFTMPVHMQYMYTFPVYAVFLNLLVLPLMGVTLFLGLLLLPLALLAEALIRVAEAFPLLSFAAAVFRAAARIAAFLLHLLYAFFAGLCRTSEGLPFARLVTGRAQGWQIVAFYAALLFLYLLCGRVRLRAAWRYLWILAAALLLFFRPASGLRLTVLSVGQGDGICIKSREATMFIDGGSSSKSALSEYTLLPFFLSEGIDRLDALFITHWDADHYNGILRLLSEEENALPHIEALCLPDTGGALHTEGYEKIMTAAERFHIPVYFLKEGDALNKGALSLHVLSPTAGYVSDDINEYSLVLRLCYGDFCALFTGDITGEAENALMEKAGRVDFLKVAHHGSAYSTPEALLQALSPKICAISVGAGNRYGHPASALLKRLAESGAAVYRTDTQGAICLRLPYARQKPYAAESAPDKAYMWQDAVKQKKVEIFGYLE